MNPQLGEQGQNWIKEAHQDLQSPNSEGDSMELQLLLEIANRSGLTKEEYLALIEGKEGEVPSEFDDAATDILDEALQEPKVLTIIADEENLKSTFQQVRDERKFPEEVVERVRKALQPKAERDRNNELKNLNENPEAQEKLFNNFVTRAMKKVAQEDMAAGEILPQTRRDTIFTAYEKVLPANMDPKVADIINRYVAIKGWDGQPGNVSKFTKLYFEAAKQFVDRYAQGEALLMRQNESNEKVMKPQRPLGEKGRVTLAKILDQDRAEVVREPRNETLVLAPVKSALAQTALLAGHMLGDRTVKSVEQLDKEIARFNQKNGIRTSDKNIPEDMQPKAEQDFKDHCYAGYVVSLVENEQELTLDQIIAAKRILNGIQNPQVKDTLKEFLIEQGADGLKADAINIVIAETSSIPDSTSLQILREKVKEQENVINKELVRDGIYFNPNLNLVDIPDKSPDMRFTHRTDQEIQELQGKVEAVVVANETTHQTISRMIEFDSKRSTPPITWEDALAVQKKLSAYYYGNRGNNYSNIEFITKSEFTPNQQRLATMMLLAEKCTTRYGNESSFTELAIEMQKRGVVNGQDILDTYNALAISVSQANGSLENNSKAIIKMTSPIEKMRNGRSTVLEGLSVYSSNTSVDQKQRPGERVPQFYYTGGMNDHSGILLERATTTALSEKTLQTRLTAVKNAITLHRMNKDPEQVFKTIKDVTIKEENKASNNIENLRDAYAWTNPSVTEAKRSADQLKSDIDDIQEKENQVTELARKGSRILKELDDLETQLKQEEASAAFLSSPNFGDRKKQRESMAQTTLQNIEIDYKEILAAPKETKIQTNLTDPKQIQAMRNVVTMKIKQAIDQAEKAKQTTLVFLPIVPDLPAAVIDKRIDISNGTVENVRVTDMNKPVSNRKPIEDITEVDLQEGVITEIEKSLAIYGGVREAMRKRNAQRIPTDTLHESIQKLLVPNNGEDELTKKLEERFSIDKVKKLLRERLEIAIKVRGEQVKGQAEDIKKALQAAVPDPLFQDLVQEL